MDTAAAARQPLLTLLAGLQQATEEAFARYHAAVDGQGDRPGLALRRLQLALELHCKLEEQLLHPALSASRPAAWPALGQVMEEVDELRDLSAQLGRTALAGAPHRPAALVALEGLVRRHAAALDALLRDADAAAVPWAALEAEVHGLLARWQAEIAQAGEVEDEDRDPVGVPPR